jgi:hypothetical protein
VSGAEIVGAKAAQAAGQLVLGEDAKTKDQLRRLAENTPEMQAAAEAYAKRVALKQGIILKLYQPIGRVFGFDRAYFDVQFAKDLAAKTADIPDGDLQSPKAAIAGPALEGLRYSFDEADLKEMYLNLLTTATDRRRSGDAHPAFAEVIRQLSPEEAPILNMALAQESITIARLKEAFEGGGFRVLQQHVMPIASGTPLTPTELPDLPSWADNWARLGLVELTYAQYRRGDDAYDWVKERPEYARLDPPPNGGTLDFDRGLMLRTAFGGRFARAVAAPPSAAATVDVEQPGE